MSYRNKSNVLKEPTIAFEQGQYDQTISLLEVIPPENPAFIKAQLNLGYAFFMKGITENDKALLQKAVSYFDSLLTKELDTLSKHEVEWFHLLAFLKMDKVDNSFYSELMIIANNENHRYSGQAKVLLDRMNTYWYRLVN